MAISAMEDIHAHNQASQALAYPFGRLRERRSGRWTARGGRAGVARRSGRTTRRALDGGKQALGVLLRARVLPLARRTSPWHPLFRLRPPRHEPSSALPAGDALVLLASPLAERPRRPRLAQGGETCGSRVDVRRGYRRNRSSKLGDTGLLLAAGREWGAWLLRRGEPVERAAAAQRIAACRR